MALNESPSIEVLRVVLVVDKDTGEKKFAWKFRGNLNLYNLIGVLDSIKHDLLTQLQDKTFKEAGQ